MLFEKGYRRLAIFCGSVSGDCAGAHPTAAVDLVIDSSARRKIACQPRAPYGPNPGAPSRTHNTCASFDDSRGAVDPNRGALPRIAKHMEEVPCPEKDEQESACNYGVGEESDQAQRLPNTRPHQLEVSPADGLAASAIGSWRYWVPTLEGNFLQPAPS